MATSGVLMSGCPIFKWYTLFFSSQFRWELIYVLRFRCTLLCDIFGDSNCWIANLRFFFELNKLSRLFVKCGLLFCFFSNFMETWSMKTESHFFIFLFMPLPFRHRVIFDSKEVNKVKIPFQLINNLVFIPINVNGVELTFGFWGKGNNSI
jgi:hypothetical protein